MRSERKVKKNKTMRTLYKFLISFAVAAAVCMSLSSFLPTHLTYAAHGNSSSNLNNAEKAAMENGDLSGLKNGADGKVSSGIKKLKSTVETIAKAAGALLLAYYLIKYEMALADDNPMSKLDATTKMGAAIALISLPSIASSMSSAVSDKNSTVKTFYNTAESSLSNIALIIGGVIVVTGVFMLIMAMSQENPAAYLTAIKLIAIGALLMGSSAILTNLNLSQYLDTTVRTNAVPGGWI